MSPQIKTKQSQMYVTHTENCINRNYVRSRRNDMSYRILLVQDEDRMFVAECPSLPGCISQGRTRKEAIENIRDAIHRYLESLKKHNEPIPLSTIEEVVEVSL